MTRTTKQNCEKRIGDKLFGGTRCSNLAKGIENGKALCGIHCQAARARRDQKRENRFEQERGKTEDLLARADLLINELRTLTGATLESAKLDYWDGRPRRSIRMSFEDIEKLLQAIDANIV